MAAVVQAQQGTGAGPTFSNAETGVKFTKDDAVNNGGTPVTKPNTTGTNYTYKKSLCLMVTSGGGSTSLSNRNIKLSVAAPTGITLWYHDQPTYAQATGADFADTNAGDAVTPTNYTTLTTNKQVWDATSAAAVNSTRNGDWCEVVMGVGSNYAGGAGSAIALPDLDLFYDEA